MKKYKYITIKQVDGELYNNKPFYRIFNNRTKNQIGVVSFYKPWDQYVFSSKKECVWSNECLLDVLDFLQNPAL